jgi:hypothetical protein
MRAKYAEIPADRIRASSSMSNWMDSDQLPQSECILRRITGLVVIEIDVDLTQRLPVSDALRPAPQGRVTVTSLIFATGSV